MILAESKCKMFKPNQISKTKMLKIQNKTYMKPSVISIVLGGRGSRLFLSQTNVLNQQFLLQVSTD